MPKNKLPDFYYPYSVFLYLFKSHVIIVVLNTDFFNNQNLLSNSIIIYYYGYLDRLF